MTATTSEPSKGFTQRLLDGIERVGNKVPHPVLMFLYLIIGVIILSQVLAWLNVSVTEQIAVPVPTEVTADLGPTYDLDTPDYPSYDVTSADPDYEIVERTIAVRGLLTTEGIRFIFTSFVPTFQAFGVVGVVFIAMMGAGVAEHAGMMTALIRKLVAVSPRGLITFIIVFVGVLSSVATDAGYLILVPLGAAAFLSLGRHPLAGLSAAFAGVGAIFAVNIIFAPLDAMLTEVTNESIVLAGGQPLTLAANYFFMIGSSVVMAIVATVITTRIIEPRLGKYVPEDGAEVVNADNKLTAEESRGLRYALYAFLGYIAFILLLTLPEGAPLRRPDGQIGGNSPLLDSLLFIITMAFLICGIAYGRGAGTIKGSNDVIAGVTKTFASLAGLVFMLLVISQFIALFNFSNLPTVVSVALADLLERSNIGAIPLMVGFILVIMLLDIIIPNSIPKWAIFAPVFIPLFLRLGVAPQTVLAAYRVGDSPLNVITPLMVYLPFTLTVVQRYQKNAGLGTVVSLMLPYSLILAIVWIIFFVLWFLLGIPFGPGYPVST